MSGISRRGFFGRVAAAIVGLAVAPHVALADTPTSLFTEFVPAAPVGEFCGQILFVGQFACRSPRKVGVIYGICD